MGFPEKLEKSEIKGYFLFRCQFPAAGYDRFAGSFFNQQNRTKEMV